MCELVWGEPGTFVKKGGFGENTPFTCSDNSAQKKEGSILESILRRLIISHALKYIPVGQEYIKKVLLVSSVACEKVLLVSSVV